MITKAATTMIAFYGASLAGLACGLEATERYAEFVTQEATAVTILGRRSDLDDIPPARQHRPAEFVFLRVEADPPVKQKCGLEFDLVGPDLARLGERYDATVFSSPLHGNCRLRIVRPIPTDHTVQMVKN